MRKLILAGCGSGRGAGAGLGAGGCARGCGFGPYPLRRAGRRPAMAGLLLRRGAADARLAGPVTRPAGAAQAALGAAQAGLPATVTRATVRTGPPPPPKRSGIFDMFGGEDTSTTRRSSPTKSRATVLPSPCPTARSGGRPTKTPPKIPVQWRQPAASMRITISQGAMHSFNLVMNDENSITRSRASDKKAARDGAAWFQCAGSWLSDTTGWCGWGFHMPIYRCKYPGRLSRALRRSPPWCGTFCSVLSRRRCGGIPADCLTVTSRIVPPWSAVSLWRLHPETSLCSAALKGGA